METAPNLNDWWRRPSVEVSLKIYLSACVMTRCIMFISEKRNAEGNDECQRYVLTPLRLWLKCFLMPLAGEFSLSRSPSPSGLCRLSAVGGSVGGGGGIMPGASMSRLFPFSLLPLTAILRPPPRLSVFIIWLINSCPRQLIPPPPVPHQLPSMSPRYRNLCFPSFAESFRVLSACVFSSAFRFNWEKRNLRDESEPFCLILLLLWGTVDPASLAFCAT